MVMKPASQPETRTIAAGEFKAKCLQLMDEVVKGNLTLIVTKRGKPVMQAVSPAASEEKPFRSVFGRTPDIRIPSDAEWREFKAELADEWEPSIENTARQLNEPYRKTKRKTK
jgi:prevent-host-death family protein